MDRIVDDAPARNVPWDVLPIDPTMSTPTGVLASATQASVAKGELLAERIVEHIVSILDTEFPRPLNGASIPLAANEAH
jgi:creatinine amidohydrolase